MRASLGFTTGLTLLATLVMAACQLPVDGELLGGMSEAPRPHAIYLPVTPAASRALSSDATTFALDEPLPIYMHRHGGTYFGGQEDSSQNRSGVVGSGSATLDAFAGGDAVWADVMECVTDQFSRFNAYVTDVEPQGGDYVEAVVGGTPQQIGLPQGVGGVAPIDTFQCNIIPKAVVYIFSGALPNNAQLLCEIAAQEIAHALSLDHELLCSDPMTYLAACGPKTFQDEAAQCGEFSPRQCACGRPSQNSVQILYDKLGASDGTVPVPPPVDDEGPPSVSISAPNDGAVLPPNSVIQVVAAADDDNAIASVELVWTHTMDVFPCPVVGQGYSCQLQGGNYVWQLSVGTGSRSFQVRARDVAGNVVETPARTISLDDGSVPVDPVDDVEAPEAAIVSPNDGAVLSANSVIEVIATVTDDVDVAAVVLEWDFSDASIPCPTQQQAATCTRQGSTYRWQLNVGTGERTFRVAAQDSAGRVTTTPSRTVSLSETPVELPDDDDYEDNDTWDTATSLACDSGLDLHAAAGDVDWLILSAAPGVEVTAQVRSLNGAPLSVALASGPRTADVLAEDEGNDTISLRATAATSYLGIRVRALGAAGDYRVVATCAAPTNDGPPDDGPDAPGGNDLLGDDIAGTRVQLIEPSAAKSDCSSTTKGDAALWLSMSLLLPLAARRRRRVVSVASL